LGPGYIIVLLSITIGNINTQNISGRRTMDGIHVGIYMGGKIKLERKCGGIKGLDWWRCSQLLPNWI
jgi:hypothetical protein